jgi:hypothetical protein
MKNHESLKELVTQFLYKEIQKSPRTYAAYIADQIERRGGLEDYLDIKNRSLQVQEEIVTRLGYDPRGQNKLEALLGEAIQTGLGLKDACNTWLTARLATKNPAQIKRAVEKLCQTIRWSTGGELDEKHLSWMRRARKTLTPPL